MASSGHFLSVFAALWIGGCSAKVADTPPQPPDALTARALDMPFLVDPMLERQSRSLAVLSFGSPLDDLPPNAADTPAWTSGRAGPR
ncbi:hypothetical protein ACFO0A_13860 [Novosphingobium tardum]|uniref:Uncharacterized protein n=1 Tax=Novosphingobium tardum TaxID=1538021 RepID=A0ABV8RUV2_9SPHN